MEVESYSVCENCSDVIEDPENGLILKGNLYVASLTTEGEPLGGLIGQGYDGNPDLDEIDCQAFHWKCFFEVLPDDITENALRALVQMTAEDPDFDSRDLHAAVKNK